MRAEIKTGEAVPLPQQRHQRAASPLQAIAEVLADGVCLAKGTRDRCCILDSTPEAMEAIALVDVRDAIEGGWTFPHGGFLGALLQHRADPGQHRVEHAQATTEALSRQEVPSFSLLPLLQHRQVDTDQCEISDGGGGR